MIDAASFCFLGLITVESIPCVVPTLVLDSGADCADDLFMFVRCKTRHKDGKEHRWSVVENVRVRGGRVVQRQVLYLGEINDSQRRLSPGA